MAQDTLKEPFEAVVIRYVHDARVGEALNVGLVLVPANGPPMCKFLDRWGRISGAFPGADLVALRRVVRALEKVVGESSGPQHELILSADAAKHPALRLVRRALHLDDSIITVSAPVSGLTADAARTVRELFDLYVGDQADLLEGRPTRDDVDVWKQFAQSLDEVSIRRVQHETIIRARRLNLVFQQSWRNGRLNVLQPLSFDMADANAISNKAQKWLGGLVAAKQALEDTGVYLLVGLPDQGASPAIRSAAKDAFDMLAETLAEELPSDVSIVSEKEKDRLARKILEDLSHE